MANLSLFGESFTGKSSEEQLELVKNARHLRRQRIPEKVRVAKVKKPKTITKQKRVSQKQAFNLLSDEDKLKMIEAMIAKKQES